MRSSPSSRTRTIARRGALTLALAGLACLITAPVAGGHVERPSYWPDPTPDRSVSPPAGGGFPEVRSLPSAATGRTRGQVRVVCQGRRGERSMRQVRRSVRQAMRNGFRLRPSQPRIRYNRARAKRMMRMNRAFAQRCRYDSVQRAVFDSGNNDRIVIMPGRYTEPESRRRPTDDPRCADLIQLDARGAATLSYRYHIRCPNDQSLIFVQGREPGPEPPPSPPRGDRKGIPDIGPCVRCNLQMDGSGVKPEDVLIDAGNQYRGNAGRPQAKPGGHAKHLAMRVDRADGFVGRNFLLRGAEEHGYYTEETDGTVLDRVKFFWNADYGHLAFTADHHLIENCDGFGSGDAVVYPGATPETGEQADPSFYPNAPRFNSVVRKCDLRGSTLAYSGSMGNAVRITQNHVYGNAAGIATDTISAAGHPGFPADSVQIDRNLIYSNNLNVYTEDPPFMPTVGIPVGVGVLWAGHNNGKVFNNWIFDNWRRGTMLLAIPDVLVEPEGDVEMRDRISCPTATLPLVPITTSCANEFFNNNMGRPPPNFRPPKALRQFGAPHSRGPVQPNGVDFWWDEFPGNTGNCWYGNTGPDGTAQSVTGPGDGTLPDALKTLPANCDTSIGLGDVVKELVLVECSMWSRGDTADDSLLCDWFDSPPQPGTRAAERADLEFNRAARRYLAEEHDGPMERLIDQLREHLLEEGSPLSAVG